MKLILSTLFVLTLFGAQAQYGYKDEGVISRFRPGILWYNTGWRPAEPGKDRKYDRLMIDATYSTLFDKKILETNVQGSFGWNLHTMWDIPLTTGNTVSLGLGLSYKHQRVGYKGVLVQSDSLRTTTLHDESEFPGYPYRHQVLGTHSVAVPVEIRFRAAKWKHLKLHLGGYFGYRVQGYQKLWSNGNQEVYKDKQLVDFNPLTYGVHARVGLRNWALFADYGLSPYFKSSGSSQFTTLSAGLTISMF